MSYQKKMKNMHLDFTKEVIQQTPVPQPYWLTPDMLPLGFFPLMILLACRDAPTEETSVTPNCYCSFTFHLYAEFSPSSSIPLPPKFKAAFLTVMNCKHPPKCSGITVHFSHTSFPSFSSIGCMCIEIWDFHIGSFLCRDYPPSCAGYSF